MTTEIPTDDDIHQDIVYPSIVPFILVHVGCLGAVWTGISWQALAVCGVSYWVRMFAITGGYHRYFAHRSYSTGRIFQFVLAFLAQSSLQRSVLWWSATHRHHHLHSDTPDDVHSPRQKGFLYSHVGWMFTSKHDVTNMGKVADIARYPELRWLHKYEVLPGVLVAGLSYVLVGWSGLVVGFLWSTVFLFHAVFCINSLAHVHGKQRYVTGDDSRNNWLLAFFTMGEGWHNNHHAYQSSARQGFKWWEVDPTYYILKTLSWFGLVWDLKTPPPAVLNNTQRLGSRAINRAAEQLAARFHSKYLADFSNQVSEEATSLYGSYKLTRDEVLAEASAMFGKTPSLNAIVNRACELLFSEQLLSC